MELMQGTDRLEIVKCMEIRTHQQVLAVIQRIAGHGVDKRACAPAWLTARLVEGDLKRIGRLTSCQFDRCCKTARACSYDGNVFRIRK